MDMEWEEEKKARPMIRGGVVLAASLLMTLPIGVFAKACIVFATMLLITGNGPYWLYIVVNTLPRDIKIVRAMLRIIYCLWKWDRTNMTVAKIFFQLAEKHPNKIAFYSEEKSYTYKEIADLSSRTARVLSENGINKETVVAMILGEKAGARFVINWLSLAILGSPAALLPPKARHSALVHAINAAKASTILYSSDVVMEIQEIRNEPDIKSMKLLQLNFEESKDTPMIDGAVDIASRIPKMSSEPLKEMERGKYSDPLFYIYTSGTTGLPKAAIIKNSRFLMASKAFNATTGVTTDDIMYTPLPLHHTSGGVLGAGLAVTCGITVALRNKFSASNYFSDCVKYKCTAGQYIGEMCRFMLVAHEKLGPDAKVPQHSIRIMSGNGLRKNLWNKFKTTFNIPAIYEFYGATEGNTNMVNIMSREGAVGFLPRVFAFMSPICLVKCDSETGEPIRDDNGFFIKCKPMEPGLLLGKLNHSKRLYDFTGYVDKQATKKKMFLDVFEKGDCYFNSGDLLVMDHFGYFYFKDRTGDTFRWRGENVSTTEVESILAAVAGMTDIVVFGVEIPNTEGRAGMAVLVDPDNKFDIDSISKSIQSKLPPYARPLFIRVMKTVPLTTTFKIIKTDLKKDGYNIDKVKDKLYFLDQTTSAYVPLTSDIYQGLHSGKIRL